jgi:hypothetical protein
VNGKQVWQAVVFGLIVTLAMNALDMLYHISTDTTVHLNYVAVKFTVIFTTTFLIALVIGRGKVPGIVNTLLGPSMFYIYYSVATPTLDRSIFTLDENVWYIVVHTIALGVIYWLTQTQVMTKKPKQLAFAALVSLAALPLYWGWLMALVRLMGQMEEETTHVLTVGLAFLIIALLFALVYGASWIRVKAWWPGVIAGAVFGLIGVAFGATWLDGLVRVFVIGIPYTLVHTTLRGAK